MDREAWQTTVYGVARVGHDLVTNLPPTNQEPAEGNQGPTTGFSPTTCSWTKIKAIWAAGLDKPVCLTQAAPPGGAQAGTSRRTSSWSHCGRWHTQSRVSPSLWSGERAGRLLPFELERRVDSITKTSGRSLILRVVWSPGLKAPNQRMSRESHRPQLPMGTPPRAWSHKLLTEKSSFQGEDEVSSVRGSEEPTACEFRTPLFPSAE